ncbi:hypothetical protein B0T10DRAFT_596513 [Thelonectria olida]|uniref:Uncharacterized protein n=1 Tax=Thelonectria olida TaxID=1576542 RepID=A0A9P8W5S6_9HYPO|nr:hypothetical protein B0T10DRAFT_596513 [Thelonectria olida]
MIDSSVGLLSENDTFSFPSRSNQSWPAESALGAKWQWTWVEDRDHGWTTRRETRQGLAVAALFKFGIRWYRTKDMEPWASWYPDPPQPGSDPAYLNAQDDLPMETTNSATQAEGTWTSPPHQTMASEKGKKESKTMATEGAAGSSDFNDVFCHGPLHREARERSKSNPLHPSTRDGLPHMHGDLWEGQAKKRVELVGRRTGECATRVSAATKM